MDASILRKPRHYFETSPRPVHVTFDDGKTCRDFPWLHYVEARWQRTEPDAIKIFIGDLLVLVTGHNLGSIYAAIQKQTLEQLAVQPDFARDFEHEADSFATSIQFLRLADRRTASGQGELDLGIA